MVQALADGWSYSKLLAHGEKLFFLARACICYLTGRWASEKFLAPACAGIENFCSTSQHAVKDNNMFLFQSAAHILNSLSLLKERAGLWTWLVTLAWGIRFSVLTTRRRGGRRPRTPAFLKKFSWVFQIYVITYVSP